MKKVDLNRDGWFRDETNGLKLQGYSDMKEKRKSQAKGKEIDLVEQREAIDERPQGLSAMVAKIQMDISSDEEVLEGSDDNNDNDFVNESESSDPDSSDSSGRFLLKMNLSNGLCVFDEVQTPTVLTIHTDLY